MRMVGVREYEEKLCNDIHTCSGMERWVTMQPGQQTRTRRSWGRLTVPFHSRLETDSTSVETVEMVELRVHER